MVRALPAFAVATVALVSALACGGGTDVTLPDGTIVDPTTGEVKPVGASALNRDGTPLFGTATLSAGFTPDPHDVSVSAGGDTEAAGLNLGAGCRGYVMTAQPDFKLAYTAGGSPLRFAACSGSDTALLVSDPAGNWNCNDDTEGTNPVVEFTSPASGNYHVWVGTYSAGSTQTSTLKVTERSGTICSDSGSTGSTGTNSTGSTTIEITGEPRYGSVTLAAGFMPDPTEASVTAGGPTNATDINGLPSTCRGHIVTDRPDYRINYTAGSAPLRIAACAGEDVTLIVNDANGNWHCADDDEGRNPVVTLSSPPSGTYDVFVGTYGSTDSVASTVKVTERSGTVCN